jgi:hypothetical protein
MNTVANALTVEHETKREIIDAPAIVPVSESAAIFQIIERAARDPNVDVDKMERLYAMQELFRVQFADGDKLDIDAKTPAEAAASALPDLPNAKTVYARGCTALAALPDLPNAKTVYASGCTGLVRKASATVIREA